MDFKVNHKLVLEHYASMRFLKNELTEKLLTELQRRLKIGDRRGVHLNAIPAKSRYKFDLNRLSQIDKNLPKIY